MTEVRPQTFLTERWATLRLLRFARGSVLVGFTAVALIAAIGPIASALLTAQLVNTVQSDAVADGLLIQAIVLATCLVATQQANSLKDPLLERIAATVDGRVRSRIRHIATREVPFRTVESASFQDDASRACDPGHTWRSRTCGAAASGQLWLTIRVVTTMALAVVVATVNIGVAVIVVVGSFALRSIARRQWLQAAHAEDSGAPRAREAQALADSLTDPRSARELAVFGFGDWMIARWRDTYSDAAAAGNAVVKRIVRRQAVPTIVGFVIVAAAFAWLGLDLLNSRISAADTALALSAMVSILSIMAFIGAETWDIDYGLGAVRAFDRIEAHALSESRPRTEEAAIDHVEIRLEGVTFDYSIDKPVLRGVDLHVRAGEKLALVGRNGAGKSTLTKLIAGLYQPSSGHVRLGEHPASTDVGSRIAETSVAVMSQQLLRMPLSLRENVTMGAAASDEEVWELLDIVGLATSLRAKEVRLDTELWRARNSAHDLSGGQWQRICLARALFSARRGRKILILDEPTSQLDVEGETRFYEAVTSALVGVTVILITHRLSTIRSADRIAMLEDGVIAEIGSHEALIAQNGRYAGMYRAQASRFSEQVG